MFASRAVTSAQTGHRFAPSAKFIATRQTSNNNSEEFPPDPEVDPNPIRGLVCALISALFCPILGIWALFYACRAVQAHRQGFYAEATTFHKRGIRWSLITFIFGLTIGSILAFLIFLKLILLI